MTCPISLPQQHGRCHWCRKALRGRQSRWCSRTCASTATRNHRWTQAKAHAKKAVAYWKCARCGGFTQAPEVNHIEPCIGKHAVWGCHHHEENLEVLCRPCHLAETANQRSEGKFT